MANGVYFMELFRLLKISLIAIKNRVTLIGEPRGSPFSVWKYFESVYPSFTRKLKIKAKMFPTIRHLMRVDKTFFFSYHAIGLFEVKAIKI